MIPNKKCSTKLMMERHAYLSSPRVLLVALPDATRINGVMSL